MFERFIVGLDYDVREIYWLDWFIMFERFIDWIDSSCSRDSCTLISIWIPLQSLSILYYILRRYLPTVDIYGGDAILVLWLIFIRLIYHVREIYCWFELRCSRDLLLVNYYNTYPTISQHPILHPPSIFTYGWYLRRWCYPLFCGWFLSVCFIMFERFIDWIDSSCLIDLLLVWIMMFERFIVGFDSSCLIDLLLVWIHHVW